MVMVPGWLSHVTELWSHPDAASALGRLSSIAVLEDRPAHSAMVLRQ